MQKKGFTLLYVGRLEPVKNHDLLLRALRAALDRMPALQLWMVGDGSERVRLEQMSAEFGLCEHVRFWGQQLDVAPFFSSADAFIMSSVSEGLPMSLLQAFSIGLPAIVTDVGGMAEVVRLAQAGLVTPSGDAEAMASATVKLATSAGEREQFAEMGEAAFRKHFTLEAMADAYMKLYRNTPRTLRKAKRQS